MTKKKLYLIFGGIVFVVVAVMVLVAGLSLVSGKRFVMDGPSMEPSFRDGDILSLEKNNTQLERSDIIVYKRGSESYVKRIIGLPGETIEILDGQVYVDGEVLDEPYLSNATTNAYREQTKFAVQANEYFVLGDNRAVSKDSRHSDHGMVSQDEIVGVVKN